MSTELVMTQQPVTPMQMIERAAAEGKSIEMLKELFDLKLRVDADNAKQAFNEAFTAFKSETIRIVRDKENKQYSKGDFKAMYASLENEVETVTPFLSKHGLTASWETSGQTKESVTLSCVLTHVLGHTKRETITGPMDTSGAKNPLQAVKSTMTYLKIATFEAVCGLASSYGNLSDDGNSSGSAPHMDADDYRHYLEQIAESGTLPELQRIYAAGYAAANSANDKEALQGIIRAKDTRKKALA